MRGNRSSIGQELVWLVIWAALFAGIAAALLLLLVPHHFNDRVAILLAAILAALAMIALRARRRSG